MILNGETLPEGEAPPSVSSYHLSVFLCDVFCMEFCIGKPSGECLSSAEEGILCMQTGSRLTAFPVKKTLGQYGVLEKVKDTPRS